MKIKNVMYGFIGLLFAVVIILFIALDAPHYDNMIISINDKIDINKHNEDLEDYYDEYKDSLEKPEVFINEMEHYRLSLDYVDSVSSRGVKDPTNYIQINNSFEKGNYKDIVEKHNTKYDGIFAGKTMGFHKATKTAKDVMIGEVFNKHRSYFTLPLDKKYMSKTSGFGARQDPFKRVVSNDLTQLAFHTGLDLSAPGINGKPIYSVSHGVIKEIQKSDSGYGNMVIVDHGDGFETYYAHMRSFNEDLRVGDLINSGTTLGYVGSTGRSTGPHLHFEVIIDGVAINPEILVSFINSNREIEYIDDIILDNNKINPIYSPINVKPINPLDDSLNKLFNMNNNDNNDNNDENQESNSNDNDSDKNSNTETDTDKNKDKDAEENINDTNSKDNNDNDNSLKIDNDSSLTNKIKTSFLNLKFW